MPKAVDSQRKMKLSSKRADKKRGGICQQQLDLKELGEIISQDDERRDYLKGILSFKNQSEKDYRCKSVVPPGSILDRVIESFRRNTNIPLELVVGVFLSYVSGALCKQGSKIVKASGDIWPNIWIIILAVSGGGKTFTSKQVKRLFEAQNPELNELSSAVSGAALLASLKEESCGLWLRDEFGQLVKQLETSPTMIDFKDYMLRMYDCDEISRFTKKDGSITVNPRIAILGLTVYQTWYQIVSPESMLDGFAQRFLYVVGGSDPSRPFRDFPEWNIDSKDWGEWNWSKLKIHDEYKVSKEAQKHYENVFREMFDEGLPESFYRRVLWSLHKLALIYHVIVEDESDILSKTDYGWASRFVGLCLSDAKKVIEQLSMSDLQRVLEKSRKVISRKKEKGIIVTPSDLVAGVREIKSAREARTIMSIL